MPIIYYPWGLQAAAIRFKSCLQENAKLHTFAEDVIEAHIMELFHGKRIH